MNFGCLAATGWDFDFVLQLLLPVIVAVLAFAPYLTRLAWNKIRPGKYTESDVRNTRNRAIASSLKFLNVVYLTVSRYCTLVFRCTALANGQSVLAAYPAMTCGSFKHKVGVVVTIHPPSTVRRPSSSDHCRLIATALGA